MKKVLYSMLALSAVLFSACSQEDDFVAVNSEATVAFKVSAPEIATRAYSDGLSATVLQYAVYDSLGNILPNLTKTDATLAGGTATVNLQLTTGNKYSVIFWAAAPNAPYSVDLDAKTMTVNYEAAKTLCNAENRDAFFKCDTFVVNGSQEKTIELRRPFAQLNVGTNDYAKSTSAGYVPTQSYVKINSIYTTLNLGDGTVEGDTTVTFGYNDIEKGETFPVTGYEYLAMNYILVDADKELVEVELGYTDGTVAKTRTVGSVPVQRNHRTNIYGQLLTSDVDINVEIKDSYTDDNKYGVVDGQVYVKVASLEEFNSAFADENVDIIVLADDVVLDAPLTRAATDPTLLISSGKTLTIDLNGKKLSSTSSATGKNYNMFDVRGTLTVKNGTMETEHKGDNMAWNNSTNLFNVTAGGVLNLEGVTARNLGGSDMGFVAHLNNWGEVTLNVDNCTLESNYVPVRVFNSGPDMNNVYIKNSTLKSTQAKYAFWVHNYTAADFGSEAKAESQKKLLNINIYGQGNTFSPDFGIRYGFTNSEKSDAYGITRTVSEDGSEVTLGSVVEDGVVRRGVAGTEENSVVTKAVVGEGITVLYDRTFRRYYALETVELPSTLTTIGAAGTGVFQSCSALKNIVIPESVTVLGNGTFYGCTSLESINIPAGVTRIEENCLRETGLKKVEFHEGVTYFGPQAFRDCKQLLEVYINAPEFTVEPNTFGLMAAPYPGTTIYVANAEMKAYLESTLTYAGQYKIVAPSVVSTPEELSTAISSGAKAVVLSAGTYVIPDDASFKTLTIYGTGNPEDVVLQAQDDGAAEGDCDYSFQGSNVVFNNVTITTTATYFPGYARMKGTFNNCIFNGVYTVYDSSTFNNCTFNISGDFYNLWTWGGEKVVLNNCTFNSDGKAILLYGPVNTKLTVNDCTFNDNGGLPDLKAAVEIGNDYNKSYELIVNNATVNGYEINDKGINTGTTLWGNKNSMPQDKLNVVIDGVDVY